MLKFFPALVLVATTPLIAQIGGTGAIQGTVVDHPEALSPMHRIRPEHGNRRKNRPHDNRRRTLPALPLTPASTKSPSR